MFVEGHCDIKEGTLIEWFVEMNLSLERPLSPPRHSQAVRLLAGIQACAHSALFAPASDQRGARGAQTRSAGWYTNCLAAASWQAASGQSLLAVGEMLQSCRRCNITAARVWGRRLARGRAGPAHASHCSRCILKPSLPAAMEH